MKSIIKLDGDEITILIEPESDIEMMIFREMRIINASKINGNIMLVKERNRPANVSPLKEVE